MKKEIIIASLIIGLSILGYGLMNYGYKTKVLNQERLKKMNNETKLEDCIIGAYDGYSSHWNRECAAIGLKPGCGLPARKAERIDKLKERNINNCIKVYSVK